MKIQTSLITLITTILLVACQSDNSKVKARPRIPGDEPKKFGTIALDYVDTSTAEWKHVRAQLDSFYDKQAKAGFNGSVLVGSQGKILYERYTGYCNREEGIPLTNNCAVQLASISKTFTGTAILLLYQNKYLDINDPVKTYLAGFPYPDITIKMLLNHRSGIPDYTHWAGQYWKSKKPMQNSELMDLIAQHKPALQFKSDTRFRYSNTNYAILASIVEEVTQLRFATFMRKYIFDPIGMDDSFVFDSDKGFKPNTTVSYKASWSREPIMFADGIVGDKGLYSTVEDMYRWDQSFYNHTLLNQATQQLAYTPYSNEKPGNKNYGLGWRMINYPDGVQIIYHNGWWHGNNTSFYRFVQDNFTIIVLGNKYNSGIYRQAPVIYNIVKGMEADSTATFGEGEE